MKLVNLGPGLAPAVTIVDGHVYVAFGVQPDALILVDFAQGETDGRRTVIADGFFDSFPRFSGPWLVYKRNGDWRPAAIDVQTGQQWIYRGQADGNFGVVVNAAMNLVAYQWTSSYVIWLGSLLDGQDAPTSLHGAPDGLDQLVDPSRVTLRKDTRLSVPGMLYPVLSGDLTVGEHPDSGIAVQVDGDELRVALDGQNTPTPSCATDGQTYALVTGGPKGVRLWLGSRADVLALPPAASIAPRVDVPSIGRALWLGWFVFGAIPPDLPGNCVLPVDELMQVLDVHGRTVAQYVAGSPDGDMDAVDLAIVEARALRLDPSVPILAYWTGGGQAVRSPVGADLVGVEAYRHAWESVPDYEVRVRMAVARCKRVWLIPNCYTSNPNNHPDLLSVVPVIARVARDCENVDGILVFSAGARATGWSDHPEVHDVWRALANGLAGTPALPTAPVSGPPGGVPPSPNPVPPHHPGPPPAPTPGPAPAPAPVPQPVVHEGAFLMFSLFADPTKHLLAVKSVKSVSGGGTVLENPDGTIVSIQPDGSVQDRPFGADGGYERCKVSGNAATFKPVDGKYYTFAFVVVEGL